MKATKKALKNQHGFSLVELMAGVAILGIVMTAIFGVLSAGLRSQQYYSTQAGSIRDERQIIMFISDEIRNATLINIPVAGASSPSISYQKSGDANNRSISVGGPGTPDANTVLFKDPNGNVVQRLGAGNAQTLSFLRDGTVTQKITVTLTMANSSNASAPSITTIVYTLN